MLDTVLRSKRARETHFNVVLIPQVLAPWGSKYANVNNAYHLALNIKVAL